MSGGAELHRRAKEVVLDALDLPPTERASFVEQSCGADHELKTEVESLLSLHDTGDDFLERPPIELASSATGMTTVWSESTVPTFEPGHIAAERFEIVRAIGEGGMGVVYEALDKNSGEAVALKVMRSPARSVLDEQHWRERFRREVQLARRVTHRNVCRIFDIFQQSIEAPGSRGPAELWMLSMELLRGESLAARLHRSGPMKEDEAVSVIRQLVAGLQAAHDAGVVHRDFKTGNVMLVEDDDTNSSAPTIRAVITDFGIARSTREGPEEDAALTATGQMMGTPLYMAPEQILGQKISPATDVYSLGVVIFEILCGQRPFEATSALSAAAQRFTEDPQSVAEMRKELSPRFKAIVSRCLERDPADRYESAADILTVLDGGKVAGHRGTRARTKRRNRFLAALAATTLLALIGLLFSLGWIGPREAAPVDDSLRPTIGVLELDNISGDENRNWWSVAISEMLIAELEAGGRANVAAGAFAADVARELYEPDSREALERTAAALDARFLVNGSYTALDDSGNPRVRLDLGLIDTEDESRASIVELGNEAGLNELVARAASRLRDELGIDAPTADERQSALARLASSSEAAEAYALGLDARRSFDARSARDHFERAVSIEPGYALAHLELANAWAELGFENRALEAARTAFELRGPLPRQDQLWIEGRYSTLSRDWDRAAELYRALWTVFPDRLDFGVTLAHIQTSAGDGQAALDTVDELRRLAGGDSDPRVDLAEGGAAWAIGDWPRHREASKRARERAEALGLRGIQAQALCEEGWALRYAGDLSGGLEAGHRCRQLWNELDNPGEEANALNFIATVELDRGLVQDAAASYEEAANRFEAMGDLGGVAVAYSNLGNARYDRGQLESAGQLYTQALDLFEQLGRPEGVSMMHNALGNVALSAFRVDEAIDRYQRARQGSRELGAKRTEALALNNLGNTYLQTGNLEAAVEAFDASQVLCLELDHRRLSGYNLWGLGEVELARANYEGAKEQHQAALDLRIENGEDSTAQESRLALARIDLYQGRIEQAIETARASNDWFSQQGASSGQAAALTLLAHGLLQKGEIEAALQTAELARKHSSTSEARGAQLTAELTLGRVELERDRDPERLRSIAEEARAKKMLPLAIEAECSVEPEAGSAREAEALGLLRLQAICS